MSQPSDYREQDVTVQENFSRVLYMTEDPLTDRLFIPVNAPGDQGGIAYGGAGSNPTLVDPGTGYSTANNVATTGGSGSGLTVNVAQTGGAVTGLTIGNNAGNGYLDGETLTVDAGDTNCTFTITVSDAARAAEQMAMERRQSEMMTGWDAGRGAFWGRTDLGSNATGLASPFITATGTIGVNNTLTFDCAFVVNPPGTNVGTVSYAWTFTLNGTTTTATTENPTFTPSATGVLFISCVVTSDQEGVAGNRAQGSLPIS